MKAHVAKKYCSDLIRVTFLLTIALTIRPLLLLAWITILIFTLSPSSSTLVLLPHSLTNLLRSYPPSILSAHTQPPSYSRWFSKFSHSSLPSLTPCPSFFPSLAAFATRQHHPVSLLLLISPPPSLEPSSRMIVIGDGWLLAGREPTEALVSAIWSDS
jgi:hypothetical protein